MQAFFDAVVAAAPDALIVGDSTRPTYYAAWQLERSRPRTYFHSASGFGTLGYALPAAFGAALAGSDPVIALIGAGIGVLLGIVLAYTIAAFAGWAVAWSLVVIVLAVLVCVGIAVGFGVYPALSAARLDPVQALQSD